MSLVEREASAVLEAGVRTLVHEMPDGSRASKITSRKFTHVTTSTGHVSEPLAGHGKRRVVSWHTSPGLAHASGRQMQGDGWQGVMVEPICPPVGDPPEGDDDGVTGITSPLVDGLDPMGFGDDGSDAGDFGDPQSAGGPAHMAGNSTEGPTSSSSAGDGSSVMEADYSQAERDAMAAKGWAMPGGKYPIKTAADVGKAVELVGVGNASTAAVRAHIIKNAKRLGATGKLPASWNVSEAVSVVLEGLFEDALHPRTRTGEFAGKGGIASLAKQVREERKVSLPDGMSVRHAPGGFTVHNRAGREVSFHAGSPAKASTAAATHALNLSARGTSPASVGGATRYSDFAGAQRGMRNAAARGVRAQANSVPGNMYRGADNRMHVRTGGENLPALRPKVASQAPSGVMPGDAAGIARATAAAAATATPTNPNVTAKTSADTLIANYRMMHGKDPSPAMMKKLRGRVMEVADPQGVAAAAVIEAVLTRLR